MSEEREQGTLDTASGEDRTGQGSGHPGTDGSAGSRPQSRRAGYIKTLFITIFVAFFLKTFVVEAFRIPSGSMENTLLVGDFLLVNKLAYGLRTPRYVPLTNLAIPSLSIPALGLVRRGDVVVFEYPGPHDIGEGDDPVYYIKRCIGDPGDTVLIRSGRVTVNGREVLPPLLGRSSVFPVGSEAVEANNYGPTIVPSKGEVLSLTPETLENWKEFIEKEHHHVQLNSDGLIEIDGVRTNRYLVQRDYYFMLGDNRGNSSDSRFWGFVPDEYVIGEALTIYWSWDPEEFTGGIADRLKNIRWNRIGTLIR